MTVNSVEFEWVDALPEKYAERRARDHNWIALLQERPGQWARLYAAPNDGHSTRTQWTQRYGDRGFEFAIREKRFIYGRYNPGENTV